ERAERDVIPQTIIDRAPSAELRDNPLDQDSLPPYEALDRVLGAWLEQDRARSAELPASQLHKDSLPPYEALDRVLEAYVEQDRSREELSQDGFDPDVVERALALIDRAEYKRRQAPPGGLLTPKAFARDRRTPITNRWRG